MKKAKRKHKIGAIGEQLQTSGLQVLEGGFGYVAADQTFSLIDDLTKTADIKGISKVIPIVAFVGSLYVSATTKNADLKMVMSGVAIKSAFKTIGAFVPNNKLGIKEAPRLKPNTEVVPIIVDSETPTEIETNIAGYGNAIAGYGNAIAGNEIYV